MANQVTRELQETVEGKLNIEAVYFTEAGTHAFQVYKHENDLFTRLKEQRKKTKAGIVTTEWEQVPIMTPDNKKHDPRYKIVATMTRDQVLAAKPVDPKPETVIKKGDILSALDISEDELAEIFSKRKKK